MIATAALAIAPGPDNIYVLMQSVVHGKKYGFATAAGLISGCLVHTSLLAFGISAVIKNNDSIFFGIKVFGALYLFFLAYKVFRAGASLQLIDSANVPKKSLGKLFQQGFIMNVLNPKVTIFFLAFFPGFLFSETMPPFFQFYILGLIFMGIAGIIFALIAFLSGGISKYFKTHAKAGLFLKWMQITVFIGIGIYLLLSDK